jgi:hypothetical protein
MYKKKVNRIEKRIVSFHHPYVRPIKRGKQGKKVEFGGKGALVYVRGFLFLDHFDHSAFAEENLMIDHLLGYVERFGKLPPYVTADRNTESWITGSFRRSLRCGYRLNDEGSRPKHSRPRIVGSRRNRGNGIGYKGVLAKVKSITGSIESGIP